MKREKTWMSHSLSRVKTHYINGSNSKLMLSVLRAFELCSCGVSFDILLIRVFILCELRSLLKILLSILIFCCCCFSQVSINIRLSLTNIHRKSTLIKHKCQKINSKFFFTTIKKTKS